MFCVIVISALLGVSGGDYTPSIHRVTEPPEELRPTIMIAMLVRNKAHILPWSLHYLENLDYPKDRISLWIRSDHNGDKSSKVIEAWLERIQDEYHNVDYHANDRRSAYVDEKGPCHWSEERFKHVISLRQGALDAVKGLWADYLMMWDVDNILINHQTLNKLINTNKTVVAPMLNTTASAFYSNFWCGMDDRGYYQRTEDYIPLLMRHLQGCFPVANVHSTILINMNHEEAHDLAYHPVPLDYGGPLDDIIILASSARYHNVPMHLLNDDFYGYMLVPMEAHNTAEQEIEQFAHLKMESIIYREPLQKLDYLEGPQERKDKLGFDKVYVINLERRPDRLEKMDQCMEELGVNYTLVPAVDGQQLNNSYLEEMGIEMLPGYADPYHGRPVTVGEIGCFLSHYFIWQDMVKNKYERVIVLEDDVRFEPYFRTKIQNLMYEVQGNAFDWELIYLGRKRLNSENELWVQNLNNLVWVEYTYWTVGYLLSRAGANKLLNQKPLQKILPVDEYLPIMFDKHPREDWSKHFWPRDLKGLSVEPLLIYPTHYTGEPGYITDTDYEEVIIQPRGDDGVPLEGSSVAEEAGQSRGDEGHPPEGSSVVEQLKQRRGDEGEFTTDKDEL